MRETPLPAPASLAATKLSPTPPRTGSRPPSPPPAPRPTSTTPTATNSSKTPSLTVVTIDGNEYVRSNTTGTFSSHRYFAHAGYPISTANISGVITFLHTDHNKTATATATGFTTPIRRNLDPYGHPLGTPTGTWRDRKSFLGKHQDVGTGLTELGARLYDPTTGRFTQGDSIGEPLNPRQNNGYNYGWNNPLAKPDANGLRPVSFAGDGGRNGLTFKSRELKAREGMALSTKSKYEQDCYKSAETHCRLVQFMTGEMNANASSSKIAQIGRQMHSLSPSNDWCLDGFNCCTGVKDDETAPLKGLIEFRSLVCTGCKWGHKPTIQADCGLPSANTNYHIPVPGTGKAVYYDIWSNIHFGHIGSAANIDPDFLVFAANVNERSTGTNDSSDDMTMSLGVELYAGYLMESPQHSSMRQ